MIKVKGSAEFEVEVSKSELARAIRIIAWEQCGRPDDAGCDWGTDNEGNTYIAMDRDWKVSTNSNVAALIDAANILSGGKPIKVLE